MNLENQPSDTEIRAKELLAQTQPLIKYLLVCAYTEQVPFADFRTAELLSEIEKFTNLKSFRP